MENIRNINMLSVLVRGPFLNFKNKDFFSKAKRVKEVDISLVSIYELNKQIIKNYEPSPN